MLWPFDVRRVVRLLLLLTFALPLVAADDDVPESRRRYQAAEEAYKRQDYEEFAKHVRAAAELRPQHPTLLYRVAAAAALTGHTEEALAALERAASMGMIYGAAGSKDFAALQNEPRFHAAVARFAKNRTPSGLAHVAFALPEAGIIPEGLAWDAKGKRFFVSSVRKGAIQRGQPGSGPAWGPRAPSGWGIFGMTVDAKKRLLWATTSAIEQAEGYDPKDKGKSALLKIDADSGKLLARYDAPADGEHHFGDVLVSGDEVFVSDSTAPVIYTLREERLVPWLTGGFQSLQGLAATKDVLYAADYSLGILAIDRRTRDAVTLRVPSDVTLLGVDGLYLLNATTLLATQNGVNPNRIIRIDLASPLAVQRVTVLAANQPRMGDPTLGVLSGDRFYFHANAQWELPAEAEPKEHVVMWVKP